MTEDVAELLEEARREHREFEPGRGSGCRECYQPGYAVDWPCIPARLAAALAAEHARAERLAEALALWEKFAWYATGKSGHSPLTMPLWYALVFEEAMRQTRALAPAAPRGEAE